jgi:proline iminopeptidase
VSETHSVYFEESGNPDGKPVLFVHGGPGGGTSPVQRRFFNPQAYRIILVDQRGCGQSKPLFSLEDNTTHSLVADMEKLRKHLKVEKWMLFGGSWGSTLSLLYAETYPNRVTELVLRGIFLIRKSEIDWFYQKGGASNIWPDAFDEFVKPIPEAERGDLVAAFARRLNGKNVKVAQDAAQAWTTWEMSTCCLQPDGARIKQGGNVEFATAFARIENHFFSNKGFLATDNWIIDNVDRIRHIPTVIVQGRYDTVCPIRSAWDLHKAFPEADLHIIPDAGHSAMEKGVMSELVAACDRIVGLSD